MVHIIKVRTTFKHSDLVVEATKQLSSRFVPSSTVVKWHIESLIDREYLGRDRNGRCVQSLGGLSQA